jgi:hypothetical protein
MTMDPTAAQSLAVLQPVSAVLDAKPILLFLPAVKNKNSYETVSANPSDATHLQQNRRR